jgi:hypothetical protein
MRLTGASDRDFIRMGRGIESRYERCSEYWEPHLRFTREFIQRNSYPAQKVAVLGAGRLLDIDLPALLSKASEVHLFDADPTCLRSWRAAVLHRDRHRIVPRIEDVTGCITEWSSGLKTAARKGVLATYIESLGAELPAWSRESFDGVVSLNIAGQLPLYWRDRVLDAQSVLSTDEGEALVSSYERMQTAHFAAVQRAAKHWGITVTDVEYYFYHVDHTEWEIEDALHGASRGAFEGLSSRQNVTDRECWLWHLAPQYIESDTEGEIHRVEAVAWSRK